MHTEIFITELLGTEIKHQMAELLSLCHSRPTRFWHLLHKRQVTKYPQGDAVPMGRAARVEGAILSFRCHGAFHDTDDNLHQWLLPLHGCAGLWLLRGCALNLNRGFLETVCRVPRGRQWGRCCLNVYLGKRLKCGVFPPSGHRAATDTVSFSSGVVWSLSVDWIGLVRPIQTFKRTWKDSKPGQPLLGRDEDQEEAEVLKDQDAARDGVQDQECTEGCWAAMSQRKDWGGTEQMEHEEAVRWAC